MEQARATTSHNGQAEGRERQTAMSSFNVDTGQITVTFHDKGNYKSLKKY
jgi:hypothetical protein